MYSIISNSTLSYLLLVKSQKSKKKKKKEFINDSDFKIKRNFNVNSKLYLILYQQ